MAAVPRRSAEAPGRDQGAPGGGEAAEPATGRPGQDPREGEGGVG